MSQKNCQLLVTGGAGFIGSHIVEHLLAQGYMVRVFDNFSSGQRENLLNLLGTELLEIQEGEISDYSEVLKATQGVHWIFHEAALVSVPRSIEEPQASFRDNILGTFNVFEAARNCNVERVIFASSAAVYGDNEVLPLSEKAATHPMSPYALEKQYAEQLAKLYYDLYNISSVALRYFNVYGPRQSPSSPYSGVISILIDRLLKRQNINIYGDGEQTRDFIYVKDVVEANMQALQAVEGAFIFNLGTQHNISINEMLKTLQEILNITTLKLTHKQSRNGDIRHSQADISRIRKSLDWQPVWSITEGLTEYLKMVKNL